MHKDRGLNSGNDLYAAYNQRKPGAGGLKADSDRQRSLPKERQLVKGRRH
jgi:hypothetical protein